MKTKTKVKYSQYLRCSVNYIIGQIPRPDHRKKLTRPLAWKQWYFLFWPNREFCYSENFSDSKSPLNDQHNLDSNLHRVRIENPHESYLNKSILT